MKILSIILRVVSLLVILGLAVVWFLNKEEIGAVKGSFDKGRETYNLPEGSLSEVMAKGLNEHQRLSGELREKTAEAAGLSSQLASVRDNLRNTEDQLRTTTQNLRNTTRDLEQARTLAEERATAVARMETELNSARQDLIRVNQERLDLNRRIEESQTANRTLQQRIVALESDVELLRGTGATAQTGAAAEEGSPVAVLERRLEQALAEIERLQSGASIGVARSAQEVRVGVDQVQVASVDQRNGLVVLTPGPAADFTGRTNLSLSREGSPIANLRIRSVHPSYVVADILPTSTFARALEEGRVFSVR